MTKTNYHHGNLRSALLTAAEQELLEQGIEKFSLRGVAKRAGVSHTAPKHHFGDKAGVLTALTTLGFERFCGVLEQRRVQDSEPALHPVVNIGLGYIEFALGNPQLFILMFTSASPNFEDAALDDASMRSYQYLIDAVQQVEGTQGSVDSPINTAVLSAWSSIHGISELLLHGRLRSILSLPVRQQHVAIKQVLEHALGAERR